MRILARYILGEVTSHALLGTAIFTFIISDAFNYGVLPDVTMVATFGGFHFLYAACTWPRRAPAAAALSGTP